MRDETKDLFKTLMFTVGCITSSNPSDRRRIAEAYANAHNIVSEIALDRGDVYPRIVVCFQHFDRYRAAGDIAYAGWMLTALALRVDERNLREWRVLRRIIDETVALLPIAVATVN